MKLTPYGGVRYHLKEWRNAPNRPQNAKELYNLRHATLRSRAIECAFGYMKQKFGILKAPLEFKSLTKQYIIIYNIFCLHNIILKVEGVPILDPSLYGNDDADNWLEDSSLEDITAGNAKDLIATQM